jgi:tricarballylate dehydrogenase
LDAKARRMDIYPSNYGKATVTKADTLEKLADELGINKANFVKTVREFNAAIQPGDFNPVRHKLDGTCTKGAVDASFATFKGCGPSLTCLSAA